jgi:hypothetical protein
MTSRFIPSRLLAYISRFPPPAHVAFLHKGIPVQETSPSLPLSAASFRIPIACTARTVPARAEPPEPRPAAGDPARDRRTIRFLGSVFTRLLAPERLLPLRRLQANNYFIYSESALRSSACIDCVRLLRLRSLIMGDNGNSGDAVTQTSTGYFLKQMFIFISSIIMNIVMFNCGLNIHTCTWIVSLTTILKCLLNYGIKICQNVAYCDNPPRKIPYYRLNQSTLVIKQ